MPRNNKFTIKVWKWRWDGEFGAGGAPYNDNEASPARDLVGVWDDAEFDGFEMNINGGVGECIFRLGRPFDDYGEGEDVKLYNMVEIISHAHGGAGLPIYRGYISKYQPFVEGSNEGVDVTCLGYQTTLKYQTYHLNFIPNDRSAYLAISEFIVFDITDENPADLIRYMVDAHNFGTGDNYATGYSDGNAELEKVSPFSPITYTSESIEDSTNTVDATFSYPTYFEVLDWAVEVSNNIDYWYMDGKGEINFKEYSKDEDHTFTFGKDFKDVNLEKSMENVYNKTVISNRRQWNDENRISLHYPTGIHTRIGTGTTSYVGQVEDGYIREELLEDQTIKSNTEFQYKGKKRYDIVSEPTKSIEFSIAGDVYDIDSIEPGQTCRVQGMPKTLKMDLNDMAIKKVTYLKDYVKLEVSTKQEQLRSQITDNDPTRNLKVVGREDMVKHLKYDLDF